MNKNLWSLAFVSILCPACTASSVDSRQDENIGEGQSALGVYGDPGGLVCGLAYTDGDSSAKSGACLGGRTLSPNEQIAEGFYLDFDGDYGLPSLHGFFHQAHIANPSLNGSSDQLFYPKGTACGFMNTGNDSSETCMGFNAATQCPSGWNQRSAGDAGSSHRYYWCEYQDPHNICLNNPSCDSYALPGFACGISSDAEASGYGQCKGQQILPSLQCPAGYSMHGFFDRGRSSGYGLGWCEKG